MHSLSVFERTNKTEGFKVSRKKTLSFPTLTQSRRLCHVDLYLSHCYNGKFYVFYLPRDSVRPRDPVLSLSPNYPLDDIHLLVICKKSMSVLEDKKLSAKNEKLKKGMMAQRMKKLEKLFFD